MTSPVYVEMLKRELLRIRFEPKFHFDLEHVSGLPKDSLQAQLESQALNQSAIDKISLGPGMLY